MADLQQMLATRQSLALELTDDEMALFISGEGWGHAEEHAARGAVYLDRVLPGWAEHVRILDLDLGDTCQCVLGQIFKPLARSEDAVFWDSGFNAGLDLLDLEARSSVLVADDQTVNVAQFLGFDHTGLTSYSELTAAWEALIAERKVRVEGVDFVDEDLP